MPIPNSQTVGNTTPESGRVISLAIHPGNAGIVFVGTANGGLFRALNGAAALDDLDGQFQHQSEPLHRPNPH